ncbi:MAG: alpha/beta fold hydrolase [Actinomycetales bacterium]|jgi:pimeloyl-ACP methyl ester carboxylesterase|uniref:Alpha/beta fold hydrolase n=1 Tax=Candidatus Phosphoribacter hodrii TaxID=2953743 RepID=A0A934X5M4_9MICO|nr:alpha/beta fold hydrolase [Candidatus Phosphoribacter hodrii]
MTPDEARDIARLGGRAATGIAGLVEHTHHGITERVYRTVGRLTGGASRPIHVTHDLVARHTFFWVQRGLEAGAWAAQVIAARAMGGERSSRSGLDGVRAQLALGIVNGVTGDRLAADASTLAIPMSLRHEGRNVAPTAEGLRAAYGMGHERIVVFVHGLVETEHAWRFRSRQRWGEAGVSYASQLAADTDWVPLMVRYNSGAPIPANADAFADLLGEVVRCWPGPLREVVIVGHSMGGLVALRALAHGDAAWTRAVRAVITVGSPREGAPLERFAVVAEEVAESSGHGRWFGGLVGMRSDGIRDLRHPIDHPPLPDWVQEYAVLATLTPDSWHPAVPRVGDGLVPVPADPSEHTVVVTGLHHLDLLNHPSVYAQLRAWLDPE